MNTKAIKRVAAAFAAAAMATTVFAATAPEIVTDEATFWLDATDLAEGEITSWADVRGGDHYTASKYDGITVSPTVKVIADGALAGKKTVDFGTAGTKSDLSFTRHNVKTAFFVVDIDQTQNAFLLGDTENYGFHRGGNGTYAHTVRSGTARLWNNGLPVASPKSTQIPTGYQLISWVNADAYPVCRLTQDRKSDGRIGGRRLCELILFSRELNHEECVSVESYLREKWYGTATADENVAFYKHLTAGSPQVIFDASAASSFHYDISGNPTAVSQWDDLSGNGNHLANPLVSGKYGTRTTANGFFPAYDMGAVSSQIDLQLTTRLTNTRTVFMVAEIADSGNVFWLGDESAYRFHRGGSGQYAYNNYNAHLWNHGTIWKNGVKIADKGNEHPDPVGVTSLYTLRITGYDCEWGRLGRDRGDNSRSGGKKVSELVTFSREVPDAERAEIEAHILKRWKKLVTVPRPLLHVDASDRSNFITNANGQITGWKNTGTVGGDLYKPEALYHDSVTYDCQFGTFRYVDNRPVFDMGGVGSDIELAFTQGIENIRTVRWAMDIVTDAEAAFFLGAPQLSGTDKKNWYDFHRGSSGQYSASSASANWQNAAISVDGTFVTGGNNNQKPPAGFHVYEACAPGNLRAYGLSQDRWCHNDNVHRNGGRQISELVIYDVPLGGIAGLAADDTLNLREKWGTFGGWVAPSEWGDGKIRLITADDTVPAGAYAVEGLVVRNSAALSGDGIVTVGETGLMVNDGAVLRVRCGLRGNIANVTGGGSVVYDVLDVSTFGGAYEVPASMKFGNEVTIKLGERELAAGEQVVAWGGERQLGVTFTWDRAAAMVVNDRGIYYMYDPEDAVTAHWTGAAHDDDFDNPGNWVCTNVLGAAIANGLPGENSEIFVSGDVAFPSDRAFVCRQFHVNGGAVAAGSLVAGSVSVTNGSFGAKVLGPSMKYVRLKITETAGGKASNRPAVGEFRLYRGNATTGYTIVDWPVGTKVSDSTGLTAVKETDAYPGEVGAGLGNQGGNECQPGDLIDGYYGNSSSPKTYGTGQYNAPAYNKWWPDTQKDGGPWTVTVEFPYPVATFSGCNFCLSDYAPRNPTAWTIEVSSDGEEWITVNETTAATWNAQYEWAGEGENVPAFLNKDAVPTAVTVANGSTVVADGNWTAAITVSGAVTFKGVAEAHLTLDAASSATFAPDARVMFDLSEYDVTKAGKQYVVAGPTEGWPAVKDITVTPPIFELNLDGEGYYVLVKSGNYWLGLEASGAGIWDVKNTKAWGEDAEATTGSVWLNGVPAYFRRGGTVTVAADVAPTAINLVGTEEQAVTFTGSPEALAGVPIAVANTNVTVTVENAEDMALGAMTTSPDGNLRIVKTGAGALTLPNQTIDLGGGALSVGAGTVTATHSEPIANGTVSIAGTLDMNGKYNYIAYTLEEGGTLVNNGASVGSGLQQLDGLTLNGDATVGGTGDFGMIRRNHAPATLALNGHTLVKTGANTFWLSATTATEGTLDIREGAVDTVKNASVFPGTVNVAAGATFYARGAVTVGTVTGAGTVSGTVTVTNRIEGTVTVSGTLAFAKDAVLDLRNNTAAFACGTITVDETLKVDVTGRDITEDTVLVSWSAKPAGEIRIVGYEGSLALTWRDNGLVALDPAKIGDHVWTANGSGFTWSGTSFGGVENNYRDPSASATFLGSSAESENITIANTRTVGSFLVDNDTTAYAIGGGNIVATNFTKRGAGSLALQTGALTHPGHVALEGGTTKLGNNAKTGNSWFYADSITVKPGAAFELFSRDAINTVPIWTIESGAKVSSATFNQLNDVTISGGTLETSGGFQDNWWSWCLDGTLTATGNATSFITTAEDAADNYGFQLATGRFCVEDGSTLEVSTPLMNGPNDRGSLRNQVCKTGAGAMVVKTTPTYTGLTDVQAGSFRLDCAGVTGKTFKVAEGATLDVGNNRGNAVGGEGTVVVRLTAAEYGTPGAITVFTVSEGQGTPSVKVLNAGGKDITESPRIKVNGGTITVSRSGLMIVVQ